MGQISTSGMEANRAFPVPSMMSKAKEAKKLEIREEVEICMKSKQVLRIESGSQTVHAVHLTFSDRDQHPETDLTIYGDDKVDADLNLIMSSGGYLTQDKTLVGYANHDLNHQFQEKIQRTLGISGKKESREGYPNELCPRESSCDSEVWW
ncbi:hypothetical protein HJG60_009713 [Phyllostomus discolor]|uniref:ribose-5-phosphate isomerase n=1 Tax=Phyllostomus discolor TaxID=89673 RepID=A0A834B9C1_9CHIR|nr:hypothetical protein HJG60_009713 [Phyllostomus discolor]